MPNIQIPAELLIILFTLGFMLQVLYAFWSRHIHYSCLIIGAFLIIICALNDSDLVLILAQLIVLYIIWRIKK